ncbi:sigma-70 family RNA polymerase sigma factor [Eubacterium sp. 1001713B170207_170306_E7]|uniref:RNA polymerase sigma factor n=1 Tax=Eubacterium sp. 1001713B170207_170306_E7 TaxID=2787097 RepID=UPI001897BB42|nr:sigma-70 family RNA polymerase sigma factor [Eubacterium sp. 1001713B170207_170306_E7]
MKDEKYRALDEWVRKAGQGDQTAREMLLMSFKPLILTIVKQYVYDPADYEDACQDAACVFLEAAHDFEPDARVYFQVFVRSRLTHYFKKRREGRFDRSVTPEESLDREINKEGGAIALIELILDEKTDVEALCLYREQNRRLLEAYAQLPPRQKAAFQYFFLQKGTLAELARAEGVSPSVMSRACRSALEKLRKAVKA